MKRWRPSRLATLLAGLGIAVMAMTWALGHVLEGHAVAQRDQHEVGRMTTNMKSVCFGRFLIDLPQEAEVELASARIDGFSIEAFLESDDAFATRLTQREAQLRAQPDEQGGNRNLELAKSVKLENGLGGKIFVHGRSVNEGTALNGMALETFHYENTAIEAMVHVAGVSIDLSAQRYGDDGLENITRLVSQLVANPDNTIPQAPGFCLDRAYVVDPITADQGGDISLFARLPSHPDIAFMLVVSTGIEPPEQGLIARSNSSNILFMLLERWRLTHLRSRARDINGLPGEEMLTRVIEQNDAHVYALHWEANGTVDNVNLPSMSFEMSTGVSRNGPVPTSLSEDAVIALWDEIVGSLRLVPIQPVSAAAPAPTAIPLGSYVAAGERCPHSGWWLCSEGGNGVKVLGGQRQYLRQGVRMPQALLLPPQSMWERWRGLQPSMEATARTAWKLVDKRIRPRGAAPLPLAPATLAEPGSEALATALPAQVEEGSLVGTGQVCPASGWWRCEDARALDGTRWFAQGSVLPSATFALAPSAFGRASGPARAIARRATWRLVRLASEGSA